MKTFGATPTLKCVSDFVEQETRVIHSNLEETDFLHVLPNVDYLTNQLNIPPCRWKFILPSRAYWETSHEI